MTRLLVPALLLPALFGPVEETLHLIPIFPTQSKELSGGHLRGLRTEKGLKAPLKVGTVPRMEAEALRSNPIIPQHLDHSGDPPVFCVRAILTRIGSIGGIARRPSSGSPRASKVSTRGASFAVLAAPLAGRWRGF